LARVTDAEVREVAPNLDASLSLDAFITAADLVVDRIAAGCGSDFSDPLLKEISRWYSAHLATVASPEARGLVKEKFEGAENTFQSFTAGSGVMSTQYGQMANQISNGCLEEATIREAKALFAQS